MNNFLDWLDEAAGGFIRLAYLIAGITAVAVYFGAGSLPPLADTLLNAGLPWALAAAVETHTYLTSRRVRAAWQERDRGALFVNLVVLALLLAFSAWNQLGYLSGSWTPPHTGALVLPLWAAYGVRALVVPAAFMAAAFLAPLAPPITAQIEAEARSVLADVFRIARTQRKRMLRDAERGGRDLTHALVELVTDDDTRRIISHAYGAIRPAAAGDAHGRGAEMALATQGASMSTRRIEATGDAPAWAQDGQQAASPDEADALHLSAEAMMEQVRRDLHLPATFDDPTPPPPPTDGGTPVASKRSATTATTAGNVTPLRRRGMGRAPRPTRDRRAINRANARSGRRGTAEQRVRAALAANPTQAFDDLVATARVAPSTASKYLAIIAAERLPRAQ